MSFTGKFFVTLMVIMLGCKLAVAQDENCELTLARATEEFQSGHFSIIPSILNGCLNEFTPEQALRANTLLSQTYLILDDPIGARESYLRILRVNPEFKADESVHPSDFTYLSKKFITTPVFAWFAKAGVNTSPIKVIHDLDVFDANAREEYKLRVGYQAAFGGDFYISDRVALRAELNYTLATYEHNTSNFFQDDTKQFVENQSWIGLPVSIMYGKFTGKYAPYCYLGFSQNYLARAMARCSIEKVRTSEDERDDKQSPDWNFLYKRNQWNSSLFVGGGLKIKIGLNYLFTDLRYAVGMRNVVNTTNIYTDNSKDLISDEFVSSNGPVSSFAHVDDYFRLNNLSFSVGYLRPIYKPREIRKTPRKILFIKLRSPQKE